MIQNDFPDESWPYLSIINPDREPWRCRFRRDWTQIFKPDLIMEQRIEQTFRGSWFDSSINLFSKWERSNVRVVQTITHGALRFPDFGKQFGDAHIGRVSTAKSSANYGWIVRRIRLGKETFTLLSNGPIYDFTNDQYGFCGSFATEICRDYFNDFIHAQDRVLFLHYHRINDDCNEFIYAQDPRIGPEFLRIDPYQYLRGFMTHDDSIYEINRSCFTPEGRWIDGKEYLLKEMMIGCEKDASSRDPEYILKCHFHVLPSDNSQGMGFTPGASSQKTIRYKPYPLGGIGGGSAH